MGIIADKIRQAIYGKDVRDSIADGIAEVETLRADYDQQVINAGNSNAEIVAARGGEVSLPVKIGKIDSSLSEKANESDVTILNSQVNNIVASGTITDGNTELIDSRVGVDGVINATSGESIRTQVQQINNTIDKRFIVPTFNNGYYRSNYGLPVVSEPYGYSEPILLLQNEKIIAKVGGTTSNVAIFTEVNSSGEFIRVVSIADINTIKEYSYMAKYDMYISVSTRTLDFKNISIASNYIDTIKNKEVLKTFINANRFRPNRIDGTYFNTLGNLSSNAGYFHSEPIELAKNEIIEFYGRGTGANVSVITEVDSENTMIKPIIISNDSVPKIFQYQATHNMYVSLSSGLDVKDYYVNIIKFNDIKFPSNANGDKYDYSMLFENAVFLGDSITHGSYGSVYPSGQTVRKFNYPSAIATKTGWSVTNLGKSGANATSWLEYFPNETFETYDVAFIMFGRNKSFEVESDIQNYRNIINRIKNDNPTIQIFLLSVAPAINDNEVPINNIIKGLANEFSIPYLDVFTNSRMIAELSDIYRPGDGVHFNKLGYNILAQDVLKAMNEYIDNNNDKFIDIFVPLP